MPIRRVAGYALERLGASEPWRLHAQRMRASERAFPCITKAAARTERTARNLSGVPWRVLLMLLRAADAAPPPWYHDL